MAFNKKKKTRKNKTRKQLKKKTVKRERAKFSVRKGGSINHLLNCNSGICPAFFQ